MIASISKGNSSTGLMRYHEDKVEKQDARFIGYNNLLSLASAEPIFKILTEKNTNISEPVFHVSLNLVPGESLSDETFIDIADDYMEAMGYSEQPYTIVRHTDKAHEHIHIISCRISSDGKAISDSNDKYKSMKASKAIEIKYNLQQVKHEVNTENKQAYKVDTQRIKNNKGLTKNHISSVTKQILKQNKFTEIQQYIKALKHYDIGIQEHKGIDTYGKTTKGLMYFLINKDEERITKAIPSSSIIHKPTLKKLEQLFLENTAIKKKSKAQIKFKTNNTIKNYKFTTYKNFENNLNRIGIQVQYEQNSSGIYGISFYENASKLTYKGSEIGLSWNRLKNILNEKHMIKEGQEERWVNTQYNYLRKAELKNHFFEYQFIEAKKYELASELKTAIENKKIEEHLSPQIDTYIENKVLEKEEIKEKEYNYFFARFKNHIQAKLSLDYLKTSILLNSFYIKKSIINNKETFHHSRSTEFTISTDNLEHYKNNKKYNLANSLYLKHFDSDYKTRNIIRDTIISLDTDDYKKMPIEMFHNIKHSYSKNLIYHLFENKLNKEQLINLATENYLEKTLAGFSKIKDINTLLLNLSSRGIILNTTIDDKYYLTHKNNNNIEYFLKDKQLKGPIKQLENIKLSEINKILDKLTYTVSDSDIKQFSEDNLNNIYSLPNETAVKELGLQYAVNTIFENIKNMPQSENSQNVFKNHLETFSKLYSKEYKGITPWQGRRGANISSTSNISKLLNSGGDDDAAYQQNEYELEKERRKHNNS